MKREKLFSTHLSYFILKYKCGEELFTISFSLITKNLRWLKRKVSPLTIPNREVKPFSADGTAICGRVCRRLLYKNRIILLNSSVFLLLFLISLIIIEDATISR